MALHSLQKSRCGRGRLMLGWLSVRCSICSLIAIGVAARAPDPLNIRYWYDHYLSVMLSAIVLAVLGLLAMGSTAWKNRGSRRKISLWLDAVLLVSLVSVLSLYVLAFLKVERRTLRSLAWQSSFSVISSGSCGKESSEVWRGEGLMVCARGAAAPLVETLVVSPSQGGAPSTSQLFSLPRQSGPPLSFGLVDIRGIRSDLYRRVAMQRLGAKIRHSPGEVLIVFLSDVPRLSWTYAKTMEMTKTRPLMLQGVQERGDHEGFATTLSSWLLPGSYSFLFYRPARRSTQQEFSGGKS